MSFRVAIPEEDISFNHEIEVDMFWIEGHAILHIIEREQYIQLIALLLHNLPSSYGALLSKHRYKA